jgi:predicted nucleotidyltransferase
MTAIRSEDLGIVGLGEIMASIAEGCRRHEIPFFVVGALARDIQMSLIHGIPTVRATGDVDVAVAVPSWAAYAELKEALVGAYGFRAGRQHERLYSPQNVIVDIVPFGEVEDPPGSIAWPPERDTVMSTLGFEVAAADAARVTLDESIELRVASIPGLAVLKLIAWSELPPGRRDKHADDLGHMIVNYGEVRPDALWSDAADLLGAEAFDAAVAYARIFGRDIGRLIAAAPEVRDRMLAILREQLAEEDNSALARDVMRRTRSYPLAYRLLTALQAGVLDVPSKNG